MPRLRRENKGFCLLFGLANHPEIATNLTASLMPLSSAGDSLLGQPVLAAVSMTAEPFLDGLAWFTNSVFVALLMVCLLTWMARKATRKMRPVPAGFQNFFEFTVEFLYNQVEQIVGPKVAPRAFLLLATILIFIVISNWFVSRRGTAMIPSSPKLSKKPAATARN